MNNYNQSGKTMTFTAPAGGVVAGTAYKIGQLLVVALATVVAGEPFAGVAEGSVTLPKNPAQAFAEGAIVYWDNGANRCTSTSAGNLLIGCAANAALAADATFAVRLNGQAAVDS